ncbi:hypothetical protein [Haliscomenobacter hydrossis]|nr:hypothetical protein [Haliscomenobacter hydrossis]
MMKFKINQKIVAVIQIRIKFFILLFTLTLCMFACKSDCGGLLEFKVIQKPFSIDKWRGDDLKRRFLDDQVEFEARFLELREQMVCDLVNNHLRIGHRFGQLDELGERVDSIYPAYDVLPPNFSNEKITNKEYTQFIYRVGFNASGTCYLILLFDQQKRYVGCYRAIAI